MRGGAELRRGSVGQLNWCRGRARGKCFPLLSVAPGPALFFSGLLRPAVRKRLRTWFVASTMLAAPVPKLFVCPRIPARTVKMRFWKPMARSRNNNLLCLASRAIQRQRASFMTNLASFSRKASERDQRNLFARSLLPTPSRPGRSDCPARTWRNTCWNSAIGGASSVMLSPLGPPSPPWPRRACAPSVDARARRGLSASARRHVVNTYYEGRPSMQCRKEAGRTYPD